MPRMNRRTVLGAAGAAVPLAGPLQAPAVPVGQAVRVAAGEDRFGTHQGLGISTIDFKVATSDSGGAVFVIENTNRGRGGPARHLHTEQEELFYVLEGEYVIDVGRERFTLGPGDSVLAPRKLPHVWAYVGNARGRLLITFTPAGQMEAFFREVSKANAMPPQDPAVWRAHGMELLGPPLPV
jgi:mannose-6-phosphate isomerase-like protein (cupin superfamily)